MTKADALVLPPGCLDQFLGRQRWFAGSATGATVTSVETLKPGRPGLLRVEVDVAGAAYQLLIGIRERHDEPKFLRGRDDLVIGDSVFDGEDVLAYEAVADPELALALLTTATGGAETAERVRPVGVEQSNSSLIYDDRLIFKIYRRLHPGPNLDAEMTEALADAGFNHVPDPIAVWSRADGAHLGFVQQFLAGGSEGWSLALTSLRDLYAADVEPRAAGGDFGSEAHRIGQMTARMHLASAAAFGTEPGDAAGWAAAMAHDRARFAGEAWAEQAATAAERMTSLTDAGRSIRVHGDYHLGQVIRTDVGWFVLDFEGEPARPPDERRRPTSPLKDVAGLLRSLHYATQVGLADREAEEREALELRAAQWEQRNRDAFLDGYFKESGIEELLPADAHEVQDLLAAFEVDKAVYEVGYELDHRPDWAEIPLAAIRRAIAG